MLRLTCYVRFLTHIMQQAQTKDVVRVYYDAIQSVERRVTARHSSTEYADA